MSILTYNGVSITALSTRDVGYDDIMSSDGQDYLCTKVTINVAGYVFAGGPGVGPAANFAGAQHLLEQPRQPLLFQTDAVLIQADATTDVKNGPFPEVVSINRIDGIEAMQVAFRVTTYRFECPDGDEAGAPRPAYVSNRWRDEETRDNMWLARRVRTGKVVVLGGAGPTDLNALKPVVVPLIPNGFVRERCVFAIQEDGLAMSYSVEDQELLQSPPAPAVEADGEFVETSPYPGLQRWGVASLRLKGTWATPTSAMIATAVSLCTSRLQAAGLFTANGKSFFETSIKHGYMKNTVHVSARAQLQPYTPGSPAAATFAHFKTFPWPVQTTGTPAFVLTSPGLSLSSAAANGAPCTVPMDQAQLRALGQNTAAQNGNPPPAAATPTVIPPYDQQPSPALLAMIAAQNGGNPSPDLALIPNSFTYLMQSVPDPFSTTAPVLTGGPYSYYEVKPRFILNPGLAELPGTDDSADVAFVQTMQPTTRLIIDWAAERVGQPPAIPTSELQADCGPVLLKAELLPGMIETLPGGASNFRVAGSFVYGFKQPSLVQFNAAIAPWALDLQNAATAVGGSLGGAITGLFLQQAAAQAVSNVSSQIFSVGPLTPDTASGQVDPFDAASSSHPPLPPMVGA